MPFFSAARPASNCGLTRAHEPRARRGEVKRRREHEFQRDEADIADDEPTGSGISEAVEIARIGALERDDPGIAADGSRAAGHGPRPPRRPAPRRATAAHRVKPPVEAPMSRQTQPGGSMPKCVERCRELHAAAGHVGMRRPRDDDARRRAVRDGLRTRRAIGGHQPGRDRLLRPGAAFEEAALDEQHVSVEAACAVIRAQRDSACRPALPAPSASNTLATMPFGVEAGLSRTSGRACRGPGRRRAAPCVRTFRPRVERAGVGEQVCST